tara:strand:+ start:6800 stop:6970 length:171 start_codon:yes stop_codon:yes gene_type:complete
MNWSANYFDGLDEFEHQYNDIWFMKMISMLKDDGVLYVPILNKSFNKRGQEIENHS